MKIMPNTRNLKITLFVVVLVASFGTISGATGYYMVGEYYFDFAETVPTSGDTISENYVFIDTTDNFVNNVSSFIDWNRSLVGYWSFNYTNSTGVYDNSSWINFGSFKGGLNQSNLTTAKFGSGLVLDGSNDYVKVSDSNSLDIGSELTVESWIKVNKFPVANYAEIVEKGSPWEYGLFLQVNTLEFTIWNPLGGSWVGIRNTSYILSENQWYHIVGVYKNDSYSKIYVNGNLIMSNTTPMSGTPPSGGPSPLYIGSRSGSSRFFNGTIDEVRVWDRALSESEIKASYNNGLYNLQSNFTSLSDGDYEYYAYAIDQAGNSNKTDTRYLTVDTAAPQYSDASANSTLAGQPALFSANWTDNSLSGYIFSTNNTGEWVNDTWTDFENQTGDAIFIDGFESGDFSKWTGTYILNGGETYIEQSSLYGSYSSVSKYNAWTDSAFIYKSISTNTAVYSRAYAKFDTYPSTISVLSGRLADWKDKVYVTIEDVGGEKYWNIAALSTSGTKTNVLESTPSNPLLNTWYSIELYVNSVSGTVTLWIDGELKANQTGIANLASVNYASFGIQNNMYSPCTLHIDNAVVSNTYIGPYNTWSNATKVLNPAVGADLEWKVYANDTAGNWNISTSTLVTTSNFPFHTYNQSELVSSYSPYHYSNFSVSWGNYTPITVYIENDFYGVLQNTSMLGSHPDYYYNSTPLGAGTYQYRLIAQSIDGSSNSTEQHEFQISTALPSVNISINGTSTDMAVQYPDAVNITGWEINEGDGGCEYKLYGDSEIGSGSLVSFEGKVGAGYNTFVFNTSGCSNYSSGQSYISLNVTKGDTSLDLESNSTWGIYYLAASNITGYGCPSIGASDVNCTLYRNTSDSNPVAWNLSFPSSEIAVLSPNAHMYVYNTTGGQNWTQMTASNTLLVESCGNGVCDQGETSSTCATDCPTTTTVATSGSASVYRINIDEEDSKPTAKPSLSVESMDISISPGEYQVRSFTIKNTGSNSMTVKISVEGDLWPFVTLSSEELVIEPNQTSFENIKLIVSEKAISGTYSGNIVVASGDIVQKIPVVLGVSYEREQLLDVIVELSKSSFPQGDTIDYTVSISNFGMTKRVDVYVNYTLRKIDSFEPVVFRSETLAVETSLSLTRSMEIPEDLEPGEYMLEVLSSYENKTAYSVENLTVVKNVPLEYYARIGMIAVLGMIGACATLGVILYRRSHALKKSSGSRSSSKRKTRRKASKKSGKKRH